MQGDGALALIFAIGSVAVGAISYVIVLAIRFFQNYFFKDPLDKLEE